MKTVIYRELDGNKIVIGFGQPSIDPVETNKIVNRELTETEESKLFGEIVSQIQILTNYKRTLSGELKNAIAKKNNRSFTPIMAKQADTDFSIGTLRTEMAKLKNPIAKNRSRLIQERAVYFTPGPGETLISEELYSELLEKKNKLEKSELLSIDLSAENSIIGDHIIKDVSPNLIQKET